MMEVGGRWNFPPSLVEYKKKKKKKNINKDAV